MRRFRVRKVVSPFPNTDVIIQLDITTGSTVYYCSHEGNEKLLVKVSSPMVRKRTIIMGDFNNFPTLEVGYKFSSGMPLLIFLSNDINVLKSPSKLTYGGMHEGHFQMN
jgi:hypothetical protein